MRFKLSPVTKKLKLKKRTLDLKVPDKKTYKYTEENYYEECFEIVAEHIVENYRKFIGSLLYFEHNEIKISAGEWSTILEMIEEYCSNCGSHIEYWSISDVVKKRVKK